jgi:CubicO group peptidase (beta-lactamase class C family)
MRHDSRRTVAVVLLLGLCPAFAPAAERAPAAAAVSVAALPRSAPERQGISPAAILSFVETADTEIDALHSFMLVRHGQVVAEGWWAPYDAQTPHVLYSLSKSFTSTAAGLAIAEGKLSLDDEVLKMFPEEAPAEPSANLRAMRLRDLLRMSAGNQSEAALWRDDPASPARNDTWTKKFLAHPVPFKPGTHFLYNSPATYMVSAMVQKATGQSVLDYLGPRLFDPLGFESPAWVASPQGVSAGAWGLLARTEEIARFGQLYLQRGKWNGRQLVPAAWVDEATARQTSNGSSPSSDWDQGYGYQFWRSRHDSYRGDGAFGQYCLVVPGLDAVVAITSGVRDMQRVMNLVWDVLLPAMKPGPVPDDPAGRQKLSARLGGLTLRPASGFATSPLAPAVSRKWYTFPENDRGVSAVALDFDGPSPTLLVRSAAGETRTPIGLGSWSKSRDGFANGLERVLSVPARPLLAASGGWTAPEAFTVKIAAYETPFYTTVNLRFEGDRLRLESEHNVAFGPTKLAPLVGEAR